MNPMQTKSQEERQASAKKGHATRKANKERRMALTGGDLYILYNLKKEIAELERKRDALLLAHELAVESSVLNGKTLLCENFIAANAVPYTNLCGIYFLVKGCRVVYVGQSKQVFSRIAAHSGNKDFDSVAWIKCAPDILDKLESLYIHTLNPPLNGKFPDGRSMSPIALDELLSDRKSRR